jgi:hypothetical protein
LSWRGEQFPLKKMGRKEVNSLRKRWYGSRRQTFWPVDELVRKGNAASLPCSPGSVREDVRDGLVDGSSGERTERVLRLDPEVGGGVHRELSGVAERPVR